MSTFLLVLGAALAAQPSKTERPPSPTLSQQLEIEPKGLFNVLEAREHAAYARYRIVARLSPEQIAQRLGEALGESWQEVPSPARAQNIPVQGGPIQGRPTGALSRAATHDARYVNEAAAASLSVRVRGVGRSNLFGLELRLEPLTETP